MDNLRRGSSPNELVGGPSSFLDRQFTWAAGWITSASVAGRGDLGALAGLDAGSLASGYEVVRFVRLVEVPAALSRAVLRIAADSRYVVWVDGVEVHRGPSRSQPHRLRADSVDITGNLSGQGSVVIAVSVAYYGDANAVWMPARTSGGLGSGPALLVELELASPDAISLVLSDSSWRAQTGKASTRLARRDVEGVPVEIVDARREDPEWRTDERHTATWPNAVAYAAGHLAGAGRNRPPADPYGAVGVRELPALTGVRRAPLRATVAHLEFPLQPPGEDEHPSERVRAAFHAASGRPQPTAANNLNAGLTEFDFGHVVAGILEVRLRATSGTVVDFDLRERPLSTGSEAVHGLRYIARGSNDVFIASESHGLRYLAVAATGPVSIEEVAVQERLYPHRTDGSFQSSDPDLDRLWAAGVRTVHLNSSDAYTDCPTREQRAWVGDAAVHLEVDLASGSDRRQAHNHLWLAASPRADGLLPMSVGGDIEEAGGTTIPAWSLHWIHALYTLARHEGLSADLIAHLPVAERILRWFERYVDSRGTLKDIPEWNFVDWSSVYTDGRSSILTGFWVRALLQFAQLAEHADLSGSARWARSRADGARDGFEDFWDAERGLYLDHITEDGGKHRRATSQLASAAAILSGLAPAERWPEIAERICDPRRLVVRSWFGGGPTGFNDEAMASWSHARAEPDWDADEQIVCAQPFGAYFVHEALAKAGRTNLILESIRRWLPFLSEGYDTFGEGWGWGTAVHAWSSTPCRDLTAFILGVSVDMLEGPVAHIRPRTLGLEWVEGKVPTRHGIITVRVDHSGCTVDSPIPISYTGQDGQIIERPAGTSFFQPAGMLLGRTN